MIRSDHSGHRYDEGPVGDVARIKRGKEQATAKIEQLLRANAAEAAKKNLEYNRIHMMASMLAGSSLGGGALGGFTSILLWFRDQVKAGGPMDYKDPARWAEALPGLPFPGDNGEKRAYMAFGIRISASDLGNLNFGIVGNAAGIPEELLLRQAGTAQLSDHESYGFIGSQWESLKRGSGGTYGDQRDDYDMIRIGFAKYNELF